ncbi:hypothetical protein GCM10027567_06170 [Spongiibacter taiwanensis]
MKRHILKRYPLFAGVGDPQLNAAETVYRCELGLNLQALRHGSIDWYRAALTMLVRGLTLGWVTCLLDAFYELVPAGIGVTGESKGKQQSGKQKWHRGVLILWMMPVILLARWSEVKRRRPDGF